ncbi:MAG: hypothetical protein JWP91_1916 [Fibrobacteres bacterium]|nr:hypothetical protein [Fibrobacterota bacterium]
MELEYVPLLGIQRDLYRMPRGMDRFREYLSAMIDKGTEDIRLPLAAINPMAKDHVPRFLDDLIAAEADKAASAAVDLARPALTGVAGSFRVGLVVIDDLPGGWTDRHAAELEHILGQRDMHQRGWLTVPLWTGDTDSLSSAKVAECALVCIHRTAGALRHGYPGTLGEAMEREGEAMTAAGVAEPGMDAGEEAYCREVIGPLKGNADVPTLIAALFGDEAAKRLGHAPLGLPPRAGLDLALADALRTRT